MTLPDWRTRLLAAGALLCATSGSCRADDDAICPDRPTKAFATCTAPRGVVQVEVGLADGAFLHQSGITTDTWTYLEPTIKYGLTARTDVEIDAPLATVQRTHSERAGDTIVGVGDVVLALKTELSDPSAPLTYAIRPFVLLPTARKELGAGGPEGGVNVPVQLKLTGDWTAYIDPEIDLRQDDSHSGVHPETVQIVGVTRSLPHNVSASGELWGDWSFSGRGKLAQASADLAVAWLPRPSLQLDGGINLGLNRSTPGSEVYVGVSSRF